MCFVSCFCEVPSEGRVYLYEKGLGTEAQRTVPQNRTAELRSQARAAGPGGALAGARRGRLGHVQ